MGFFLWDWTKPLNHLSFSILWLFSFFKLLKKIKESDFILQLQWHHPWLWCDTVARRRRQESYGKEPIWWWTPMNNIFLQCAEIATSWFWNQIFFSLFNSTGNILYKLQNIERKRKYIKLGFPINPNANQPIQFLWDCQNVYHSTIKQHFYQSIYWMNLIFKISNLKISTFLMRLIMSIFTI